MKRFLAGFVVLIAALYFGRFWIARGISHVLIHDDSAAGLKADAILVLSGDLWPRLSKAAELFRQGTAPEIHLTPGTEFTEIDRLFPQCNESVLAKTLAARLKIPMGALLLHAEKEITSTRTEAAFYARWFKDQKAKYQTVVIVTTWFHTARARWVFEKAFKDSGIRVLMIPASESGLGPDLWWHDEQLFLRVFNEYLKWFYYLLS